MKQILRITKTELQVLFYSPIAWFILIVFMVQLSLTFFGPMLGFASSSDAGRAISDLTYSLLVARGNTPTFFPNLLGHLFFYIPLLTMGIMSKELSSGSIKLLFSSPINNIQIVLGKFFSIAAYGLMMVFIIFLFVILTACVVTENFDWAIVPVALLGIFLLICAYGAVGLFMSSLTSYQMVSMLSTLVVLTFFSYVGSFWQDVAFVRDITYWLSMNGRASLMVRGVLCSEDFIYYITVIFLFLSLAVLRLRVKRERMSKVAILTKYASVFAVVIVVAFVSSRPALKKYYDSTRFERHTLTKSSQDIIGAMEGDYTVITYVNIFDRPNIVTRINPRRELSDINNVMGPYTRFKPDMKLKYVYYYSMKGDGYYEAKKYSPKSTDEELLEKAKQRIGMEKREIYTEEEIMDIEPLLAVDDFKTVKVIISPDGAKGVIRYFDDLTRVPTEAEISASFKRMTTEVYPKVAFVEGHEERSIRNHGDLSYSSFTDKYTRSSLFNQGYDVTSITLDEPVASDINIVVIADPRMNFSDVEFANFEKYVAAGGNIIVLGETMRSQYINPIMETFGYKLADGCLVNIKDGFRADIIAQKPHEESRTVSYFIDQLYRSPRMVSTPSTTYLEKTADKGFNERVLVATDARRIKIWNELETRYFDEFTPEFNPEKGEEIKDNAPIAIALDREINGKTQKIVVGADADFFSNEECGSYPHKIPAQNRTMITGIFEWMSDGVSPIDMRRPSAIDTKIGVSVKGVSVLKQIYLWGIPLIMLIVAVVINIRRRAK